MFCPDLQFQFVGVRPRSGCISEVCPLGAWRFRPAMSSWRLGRATSLAGSLGVDTPMLSALRRAPADYLRPCKIKRTISEEPSCFGKRELAFLVLGAEEKGRGLGLGAFSSAQLLTHLSQICPDFLGARARTGWGGGHMNAWGGPQRSRSLGTGWGM